jgi:serine protein kinase
MSQDKVSPREELISLGEEIRDSYIKNRRVMSFAEYLDLVASAPTQQLRASAQYIKDCFDFYGNETIAYPWGEVRRFRLFDCPWDEGRDRLIGQEDVQNRLYRALANFVSEGQSNKLVLLHGPNGSAKSTLIRCIGRALENYSAQDEGALYRINWIFPAEKVSKSGIGFSGGSEGYREAVQADSYAYLPNELIDARLTDELRDHPMFLLPSARRRELMTKALEGAGAGEQFVLSDYLQYGRLSHKNHLIFEALLASYQGDYLKVLRHVQIERFYVESRYREGLDTVEPQLSVDASERQLTADRSVTALPSALQTVSLFEYGGELVNGNRGLIEYSDLLKRPLEAYKYLITTVETSMVSLSSANLHLDLLFLGTSNEIHLAAFKEIPEFQSFKGRLELVRVPYLLNYVQEKQIYEAKLREAASSRHVAPHCAEVAALWAVLTRMRKPMADRYPKELADLVSRLGPLEKAELYARGVAPEIFNTAEARDLVRSLDMLWRESESYPNYEGRTGASPREIQVAIFNAASSTSYGYLSPLAILDELDELLKHVSVYEFLKQETLPGGYHDNKKFVQLARERLLDLTDEEVKSSLGLVEETEYDRIFQRYVTHVTHWTRSEKVRNPTTDRLEDPDENLMREVEVKLELEERPEEFRHDLIARIGAWFLDNPGEKPDYAKIFSEYFRKLREAYFEEQHKVVSRAVTELLTYLSGNENELADEAKKRAAESERVLIERYGYIRESARDAVSLLVRARYAR